MWRRYRPVRDLHLVYLPAKVCGFCHAHARVPSRDGWRWQVVEVAGVHAVFAISCCPSCYRSQRSTVRRRRRALAELEPVVEQGLPVRPRRCPKCEELLDQEPGYSRCRWGCGKLWPIRGASLVDQLEFERRSGLLLIA
jgi:hypothetical protein